MINNHTIEREELAVNFGLAKGDKNFHRAFDCTKVEKRAKGSKCGYANSELATVGDAVIKLYFAHGYFVSGKNSRDITLERIDNESDEALCRMAEKLGWAKLIYGIKAQPTDNLRYDPATLFEAVIGAVFLKRGYKATYKKLDEIFK